MIIPEQLQIRKLIFILLPWQKISWPINPTLKKRLGFAKAERLKVFNPDSSDNIDTSYDNVADLYARTFEDIKVRRDEFNWILKHLPTKQDVSMLDIGCGNEALLKELANKIRKGVGVDTSENLLKHAKEVNKSHSNLTF